MTPYCSKLEKLQSLVREHMHTIATTPWVSVIIPSTSNLTSFLDDDKIPTLVPPYHVDSGTNA